MSGKFHAFAVIGGGYGDEGKGLMTDFYASMLKDPVVVRSNGGAQAGHTVVTPDGRRHVFSHFGSGTFAGGATYLSQFFVVNPTLFRREHQAFVAEFGIEPEIVIDKRALVTTPYEMLVNQTLEQIRGDDLHGSCGVGFGETLERAKRLRTTNIPSFDAGRVKHVGAGTAAKYLRLIRDEYIMQRIDVNKVSDEFVVIVNSDELIEDYLDDLSYLFQYAEVRDINFLQDRNLVFEGAQGLMLDQDYGHFPYVTRSNTGMRNVTAIMEQLGTTFHQLVVNYVTRAYTTRHGAGPLPFEQGRPLWVKDDTNVYNEWQHDLRYAPLNPAAFTDITSKDFALYGDEHNGFYDVQKVTTVTCVDQFKDDVEIVGDQEEELHFHPGVALQIFESLFDYISQGPTRNDIHASDDP